MKVQVHTISQAIPALSEFIPDSFYVNFKTPVRITGVYFTASHILGTGVETGTNITRLQLYGKAIQLGQGSTLYESAAGVLKGYPTIRPDYFVPLDIIVKPADGNITVNLFTTFLPETTAAGTLNTSVIFTYEDLPL